MKKPPISYDLIKHLEWTPGDAFTIDFLITQGKVYYSEEKDTEGNNIGVAKALEEAYAKVGANGIVASLPYLLAGKARDKNNYLWENWVTTLSEENVGIDPKNGKPVVVIVHGGGILTPERIMQAYAEGLTEQRAAKYTSSEFKGLLEGKLPSGEKIELYTVEDVKDGNIPDPFGRYAITLDFEDAKATESNYQTRDEFVNNPLVIARAGTLAYLGSYFDKAQSGGAVGNWHRFEGIDSTQHQGRLLFVGIAGGLHGSDDINSDGRFVGVVAPETHGAVKK